MVQSAACEEILNKALEYTANFHYEPNTEVTETADDVFEQDDSNYSDDDIVLEPFGDEGINNIENTNADIYGGYNKPQLSFLEASSKIPNIIQVDERMPAVKGIKGFKGAIRRETFEKSLRNPNIGDTVIIKTGELIFSNQLNYLNSEIIGILVEKKLIGNVYECVFNCPEFETAVEKKNVTKGNY